MQKMTGEDLEKLVAEEELTPEQVAAQVLAEPDPERILEEWLQRKLERLGFPCDGYEPGELLGAVKAALGVKTH